MSAHAGRVLVLFAAGVVACGGPTSADVPSLPVSEVVVPVVDEVPPPAPVAPPTASVRTAPVAGGLELNAMCDPLDDRCAPELRCDTACEVEPPRFACVRSEIGPVPGGGECTDTLRCVRGSRCVYQGGDAGPMNGTCRAYCHTDGDCSKGERCVASETYCQSEDGPSVAYRECRPKK